MKCLKSSSGSIINSPSEQDTANGLWMTLCSYVLWGAFPVYFYWLRHVSATEILAHRILWSLVLLLLFGVITGVHPWRGVIASRRNVAVCLVSALLLSVNWLIYIWAIGNGRALEGSLGYFINPLVSVLLAVVVLNEALSKLQLVAILMATVAVLYLTFMVGEIPWVAISLAFAFGAYGLIHKKYQINAIGGLTVETMLMAPFAAAYLVMLIGTSQNGFLAGDLTTDLLLLAAGPITSIPLLLYLKGLSRLRLSTVALLQYTVPSLQFLVAVYILNEPLSREKLLSFVLIWLGLLIFSVDILQQRSRNNRLRREQATVGPTQQR
ncbi:MAG: EamA family transporter RarD [Pseudomonadota bacterium]